MKRVLNESKAGKGAQDFLQKTFKVNQKKFADLEKKLKAEEEDLLNQKTILNKEQYKEKSKELRNKVIKYQADRRTTLDKITSQRSKAKDTLYKKIDPILSNYIKENNVSLVLDKKVVLGGQNEFDITNIIVDKLNKELPSIKLE